MQAQNMSIMISGGAMIMFQNGAVFQNGAEHAHYVER
jgi:hypothetical protein